MQSDISLSRRGRPVSSLLLGCALLLGLAAEAGAQVFTRPLASGLGATPQFGYIDLYYQINVPITPFTFPAASGGTGTVRYSLDGGYTILGLTFDPATRILTGTPTVAGAGDGGLGTPGTDGFPGTYVAGDNDSADSLDVFLTICESDATFAAIPAGTTICSLPPYVPLALPETPDLLLPTGVAISPPLTLPEATGGTGANPVRFHVLRGPGGTMSNPRLPEGLTYDRDTRVLSGTPTAVETLAVTYVVTELGTGRGPRARRTFTIRTTDEVLLPGPDDQTYAVGTAIEPLTLAETTSAGAHNYDLTGPRGGALPAGLTFDANTITLTGTPTTSGATMMTYSAVRTSDRAIGDVSFTITVSPPGFASAPSAQTFPAGAAIAPLTLPEAAGGVGAMRTYALFGPGGAADDPMLPAGLSFDSMTRVLTGTPTVAAASTMTYTTTDEGPNTGMATFTLTVSGPMFASAPSAQSFTAGTAITPLTLPGISGGSSGDGAFTLFGPGGDADDPMLPPGLTFGALATRIVSGTPTRTGATTMTYLYIDQADNRVQATFDITVTGGPLLPTLNDLEYAVGREFTTDRRQTMNPLTLPEVTSGGVGTITYALTGPGGAADAPMLPAGLSFDSMTRVLTGTPNVAGTTTMTYTATDENGNTGPGEFDIVVLGLRFDSTPANQNYRVGTAVTTTLPGVMMLGGKGDGVGEVTYALYRSDAAPSNPRLPAGLAFDPATRIVSGTPTAAGVTDMRYSMTDTNNNVTMGYLNISVAAVARFPSGLILPDLRFTATADFEDVTLPPAVGGTSTTAYELFGPGGDSTGRMLPAGLAFDPATRILNGTPTETGTTAVTYSLLDSMNPIATLSFNITVVTGPTWEGGPPTDRTYTVNAVIPELRLPFADNSGGSLVYSLLGPDGTDTSLSDRNLPPGLTFDESGPGVFGTPTETGVTELTFTATDTDSNTDSGMVSATFRVTVVAGPTFPDGFADQVFPEGMALDPPLTLPQAASQSTPAYTLTGLPEGLTFDPAAREISGTPTEVRTATTLTYTATDDAGAVSLTFAVTVTGPAFVSVPPDLTFAADMALTPLTLPQAATGEGDRLTYTLTGPNGTDLRELPGLTFTANASTPRILTGTPTSAGMREVTYTATNAAGSSAVATFTITVTSPAFAELVPDQFYGDFTIEPLTLPQASGGDGRLTYALRGPDGTASSPRLPAGLTFDPATRTLTGSPTAAAAGETTLTYIATDAASERIGSLVFTVRVVPVPRFAGGTTIDDQTWNEGQTITPLTLPQATGGSGTLYYNLLQASRAGLPAGLVFDPITRVLSGTPHGAENPYQLVYYALDDRNFQPTNPAVGVRFTVTINNRPYFSDVVGDQAYRLGPILRPPLTLPQAGGGVGDLTYTLTGPGGTDDAPALPNLISFDPITRIVSGDPTEAFVTELTYTASDTLTPEPGTVSQTFTMTFIEGAFFRAEVLVPDQGYVIGTAIEPMLTLPTALSSASPEHVLYGPGGIREAPRLPPGLSYDAMVLSGTPSEAGVTELIYTALIAGVDPSLTFSVTVRADGENTAPTANANADRTVVIMPREIKEVDLSPYFTDPDGDPLTYTADVATDDQEDVEVERIDGAMMTLIAGPTPDETPGFRVTVTATDSFGATAELEFTVIIVRPPTLFKTLWDVTLDTGEPQTYRELTPPAPGELPPLGHTLFDHYRLSTTDPQLAFRFEVSSSAPDIVAVRLTSPFTGALNPGVSNAPPLINLVPGRIGDATITVRAYDQRGMSAVPETAMFTARNRMAGAGGGAIAALNAAILPEIASAMAESMVSAIAQRVDRANNAPAPSAAQIRVGGQDTLAGALTTHGAAMTDDSRGFKELLSGSGFVLPLNASGGAGGIVSSASLWGSGEYRNLSGESGSLDWDGDLSGIHLGVDARLREDVLGGVAVSWLESDLDYDDDAAGGVGEGEMVVDLTSVSPYIGWRAGGLDMWASAGYGEGEQEIKPQRGAKVSSDINLRTFAVGGSGRLWEDGARHVRLKGEAMQTELEVEGGGGAGGIPKSTVDATRVRFTLEASQTRALADGGVFEPSLEVGVRHDGGDGETGAGAEIGGALRYHNPATGLTAEGRIHASLRRHGGEYEEWGISGSLRRLPGADGQGLSFSLSPGYGNSSGGGLQELWRQGVSAEDTADATADYHARLDARLGYGFSSRRYDGVLTPYTELTLGTTDRYHLGMNWSPGPRLDLTLLGERSEGSSDPAEHRLLLKGEVRF